jgi:hypothetical protein
VIGAPTRNHLTLTKIAFSHSLGGLLPVRFWEEVPQKQTFASATTLGG